MFFFFKQKTAYEMRISDWSSDVCSSDLRLSLNLAAFDDGKVPHLFGDADALENVREAVAHRPCPRTHLAHPLGVLAPRPLLSGKPRLLCVVHAERADNRGSASLANQPTLRGVAVVGFPHLDAPAGRSDERREGKGGSG